MIKSIVTDFLQVALPSSSQASQTGVSVVDETFQKIFSSIQETNRKIENRVDDRRADDRNLQEREIGTSVSNNETDETTRNEDDNQQAEYKTMNTEPGAYETSESEESARPGDKVAVGERTADDTVDDEELTEEAIKEKVLKLLKELMAGINSEADLTALEKAASMIAKRLFGLSESDPAAFQKLMDDFSKISFDNKGKNLGQAVSQMMELLKIAGVKSEAVDNQDNKSLEALLNKALKQGEKTDNALEDKNIRLRDFSEKGEKRADGQPFDKALDAGNDKRLNIKAANNKDTANQQAAAKQAISNETINAAKDQVKTDLKPNSAKTINNVMAETNPAPADSRKTAGADQPQKVSARFTSREVFERMLVDQIVKKARINIRANGVSNIVVQIDPPNLGKVNIRISVHDNLVRAYLIADNPEVRSIIDNNLDNLKNSMNNQGLKVDQISVTTQEAFTRDRNETLRNDFGSETNRDNQEYALGADEAEDAEGELTIAQARALAHDGVLNIVA